MVGSDIQAAVSIDEVRLCIQLGNPIIIDALDSSVVTWFIEMYLQHHCSHRKELSSDSLKKILYFKLYVMVAGVKVTYSWIGQVISTINSK